VEAQEVLGAALDVDVDARSRPLTVTCAKLHRDAGTPAAANVSYTRHCRISDGSCFELLSVKPLSPSKRWSWMYSSNLSLRLGRSASSEPRKPSCARRRWPAWVPSIVTSPVK